MKYLQNVLPLIFVSLVIFGGTLRAEFFSISAGFPLSHDISDENLSSEGVRGIFVHVKLPILVGVGLEKYETKIKENNKKIGTTMYDIFYLLPIPIINLTIGVGAGESEFICSSCSSNYDKGMATQAYTSLGIPFLGIMDGHLSYRSLNSTIKKKDGSVENKTGGSVIGAGISIGF